MVDSGTENSLYGKKLFYNFCQKMEIFDLIIEAKERIGAVQKFWMEHNFHAVMAKIQDHMIFLPVNCNNCLGKLLILNPFEFIIGSEIL